MDKNGDVFVLQERKVTQDWSWMENRWILIKGGKVLENSLSHRIYSAIELKTLLIECGFKKVDVFGNFAGSPYDQNAKRLITIAFK